MRKICFITMLLLLFISVFCFSQIPQQMSYQGYLTDNAGNPVTGNHKLTFTLYDAQGGGNTLWLEEHPTVAINQGVFRVQLGSLIPLNLAFDIPYWLSIKVDNDPELAPRVALSSVPYSFQAHKADSLSVMPKIFYRTPFFMLQNSSTTFQPAKVTYYNRDGLELNTTTLMAERNLVITGCQIAQDDDPNGDIYHMFLTRNSTYVGAEFTVQITQQQTLFHVNLSEPVHYQKGQRIGLEIKSEDGDVNGEELFILLDGYCID